MMKRTKKSLFFSLLSFFFPFQQLKEQLYDGSLSLSAVEKGQLWVSMLEDGWMFCLEGKKKQVKLGPDSGSGGEEEIQQQ